MFGKYKKKKRNQNQTRFISHSVPFQKTFEDENISGCRIQHPIDGNTCQCALSSKGDNKKTTELSNAKSIIHKSHC